jgi:hypothetical protein
MDNTYACLSIRNTLKNRQKYLKEFGRKEVFSLQPEGTRLSGVCPKLRQRNNPAPEGIIGLSDGIYSEGQPNSLSSEKLWPRALDCPVCTGQTDNNGNDYLQNLERLPDSALNMYCRLSGVHRTDTIHCPVHQSMVSFCTFTPTAIRVVGGYK